LLSNAVKFTPAGGRIHVSLRTTAEDAVIAIADDGPGIEPGSVPHMFERFRQGTASTKGAPGGLGLGLWLVREIVRAHGGEVTVESPGEQGGSTFSVRLLRGRVHPSETMR
ncbi:MAG: ATP-binding protein, partial [Acidobacteria bacterium]|nr:ATP-binding protein [Acidobacteriota bacterium]